MTSIEDIPNTRPAWGDEAAIVVPKIEQQLRVSGSIDPASGIVAFRVHNAPHKLIVYYEGNQFHTSSMAKLEDRVMNAYGRMSKKYPTIAMSMMDASDFEVVGTVQPDRVQIDHDHPALQTWVAVAPRPDEAADSSACTYRRSSPRP